MGRFSWCATSSESEPDLADFEEKYLHETPGFLDRCYYCKRQMGLETDKDPRCAGRLTYVCPNHRDGGDHQTKWWDVAVTEEIEAIRNKVEEQNEELVKMTINKEAEVLERAEILARMKKMEESFLTLKDDLEVCSQDLLTIKEDIVARLEASKAEEERVARLIENLSGKRRK